MAGGAAAALAIKAEMMPITADVLPVPGGPCRGCRASHLLDHASQSRAVTQLHPCNMTYAVAWLVLAYVRERARTCTRANGSRPDIDSAMAATCALAQTALWHNAMLMSFNVSGLASGSQSGTWSDALSLHIYGDHLRLVECRSQGCLQWRRQPAVLQRGCRRDAAAVRLWLQQLLPQPGRQLVQRAKRLCSSHRQSGL